MSNENGPNDRYDDEMNGLTDCMDKDCVGEIGPSGTICEMGSTTEFMCNDAYDNDGDGLTDCDDPYFDCPIGIQEVCTNFVQEPPSYGATEPPEIKPILGTLRSYHREQIAARCESVVGPPCSTKSDQKCESGECGEDSQCRTPGDPEDKCY